MLKFVILLGLFLAGSKSAFAQIPSLEDLSRNVNEAASQLSDKRDSILGFKKLEMPKPLAGLLDIRFKKPEFAQLALFEKLKNIGKPKFGGEETTGKGPILAGLSKLFPSREPTTPSLIDRMLGKSSELQPGSNPLSDTDINELKMATKGLQEHVGRMSRDVRTNATELFSGQKELSPQPPLRSARQYSGQTQSR